MGIDRVSGGGGGGQRGALRSGCGCVLGATGAMYEHRMKSKMWHLGEISRRREIRRTEGQITANVAG